MMFVAFSCDYLFVEYLEFKKIKTLFDIININTLNSNKPMRCQFGALLIYDEQSVSGSVVMHIFVN